MFKIFKKTKTEKIRVEMILEWRVLGNNCQVANVEDYRFVLERRKAFVKVTMYDKNRLAHKSRHETLSEAKEKIETYFVDYLVQKEVERKAKSKIKVVFEQQTGGEVKPIAKRTKGYKKLSKVKAKRIKPIMDKGVQEAAAMLGAICSRGKK